MEFVRINVGRYDFEGKVQILANGVLRIVVYYKESLQLNSKQGGT